MIKMNLFAKKTAMFGKNLGFFKKTTMALNANPVKSP